MGDYAAIAGLVTIGIIIGIFIGRASKKSVYNYTVPREPVDSLIRNACPVSPATKMRQIIDAMELERRSPPEPPTMAELAREQSDKVKNEWINDRLPSLMDEAMRSVYEAGKEGKHSVVFYTGEGRGGLILSTKSKEAALAVELKDMLRQQGFDVTFDWAAHKTDSHGYGMLISW